MTKRLLYLILLCYSCLQAQELNFAKHSYIHKAEHLICINSKCFYSEKILFDSYADSSNIVGIDNNGKILFKYRFAFDESTRPSKIIKTRDNCILVAGIHSGCDFDWGPGNFIVKLDTNGQSKFTIASPTGSDYWPGYLRDFVESADGRYHFLCDSSVLTYSEDGAYLSRTNVPLLESNALSLSQTGNFIVNGYDSNMVTKNLEIDANGVIINSHDVSEFYTSIKTVANGKIYALANGKILRLNSSLIPVVSTHSISGLNAQINAFFPRNDSIFFTGTSLDSNSAFYGILNLDLNPLFISQSNYKGIFPYDIAVTDDNKICILSNGNTYKSFGFSMGFHTTFMCFYKFSLGAGFPVQPDIGVENFSLLSAEKSPYAGNPVINLKVIVKNFSNDTIRSFCLNSSARQNICGFNLFHKQYFLKILPKSSVVVETGKIFSSLMGYASQTNDYIFDKEVCLFTTIPNQRSDGGIENDAACSRVSTSDTIVKKSDVVKKELLLYPNPFSDVLFIESRVLIEQVGIYDMQGRIVTQKDGNHVNYTIRYRDLAMGVYILKIKTTEGTHIKKVVKE